MNWQAHPSVVPLLFGSTLLWGNVGYLLWRRQAGRRAPGQLLAAGVIASLAVAMAGFALEQARTTLAGKVFWNQLQYVGDAPLAAFLLAYVLVYLGYDVSRRQYAALFVLPVIVLVGVVTNGRHGLHWTAQSLGEVGGYVIISNEFGPLFWLYTAYTYGFLLISVVLLVTTAVDAEGTHRRQLWTMVAGGLLPGIAGIAYILGVGPTPTPNYPTYAYVGTALAVSYTVYRDDLFATVPVARRTTLEQLDDGLLTLDNNGVVVSINEAASDLLAPTDRSLVDQADGEALDSITDAFDLDDPTEQVSTIETDDGVFEVTVSPLSRGETVIGRQLLIRDLTERYRREQRLRTLNTRLELALDETDTGIWELDLTTGELLFDAASERLYGYDPGAFPGTMEAFADRLSDADFAAIDTQIQAAIDRGEEYRAEFPVDSGDGDTRWVQSRGVVQYDATGTPTRILGIQTDSTDRKRTQQRLEGQNRRLELLNKLVRHDIRTEAHLISALATKLDSPFEQSADADDRVDRVEQVTASASRITELTRQAKELMSVISSLGDSLGPIQLANTLDREIAAASTLTAAATIRTEELPDVAVRANEMLGPLFRNLLMNAIVHNDSAAPEIVVTGDRQGGTVAVTVADNGPGIPRNERESVFVEGKTLAESDGTGFGLYLVDTLVEQYGGDVTIADSELGGTAITVTLDIA